MGPREPCRARSLVVPGGAALSFALSTRRAWSSSDAASARVASASGDARSLGASEASERFFFPADWTRRRRASAESARGNVSRGKEVCFRARLDERARHRRVLPRVARFARHSIPPPRPMTRRDPRSRQSASSSSPRRPRPCRFLTTPSWSRCCRRPRRRPARRRTARQTSRPVPAIVESASRTNASPPPDASPLPDASPDGRLLGWWWLYKWMPRVVRRPSRSLPPSRPETRPNPPLVEPNCPEVVTTNGAPVRDCCCRSGCAISGTQGPACAGGGNRCQPGQTRQPVVRAFAGGCAAGVATPFYGYGAYADVSRRAGTTAERD